MIRKTATYQEIISQPAAWTAAWQHAAGQADAFRQLWQAGTRFSQVIFTGCGSTYYLSVAAATLWQMHTGTAAQAVPAGELLLYPEANYATRVSTGETLLVAVSRSGRTTETVTAVRQFHEARRGRVVVVTNAPDSPLAASGDLTIAIPEGQEVSLAQTRSFAAMYVATTALTAAAAGRDDWLAALADLPAHGQRLITTYEPLARRLGEDLSIERFYFLGSGPRYGLACETNLKLKEMSLTDSEPFHFWEFRHGPKAMVNEQTAVIGLLSDSRRAQEAAVLNEMQQLGGRVVSLGETDADIAFHSGLPEASRNVLYLPILQLIACARALAKGLNPDQPANLSAVIELDLTEGNSRF